MDSAGLSSRFARLAMLLPRDVGYAVPIQRNSNAGQLEKVAFDLELPETEVASNDSFNATLHAEYLFAKNLISIWPSLGRTTDFTCSTGSLSVEEAHSSELRTTLVELPHGFIIPGGRFRELYYWDAYWTIRGLLYSGMVSTARGMILNFAHLIKNFGFIPNGTRTYYLTRSQPPVFSLMLSTFFAFTGDLQLVRDTYLDVEREYFYWIDDCERQTTVTVGAEECHLQRYVGHQSTPRPEGWKEDVLVADFVRRKAHESNCENPEEACASVCRNIRAAAESAPAAFNAKLKMVSKVEVPRLHIPASMEGFDVISNLLRKGARWLCSVFVNSFVCTLVAVAGSFYPVGFGRGLCDEICVYRFDFDTTRRRQSTRVTAGGVAALLMQLHFPISNKRLCRRFGCERGSRETGAAPCLCADSGVADCGLEVEAHELQLMAVRFLVEKSGLWNTWGLSAYKRMGALPEKSSSLLLGSCGGGGEYVCQKGFGWSIAVALELLFLKRVGFSYMEMRSLQREFGSAAFSRCLECGWLS
ncbi:hypothetical protein ACSSS7_001937 [Eimeria intestinalis]